MTTRAPLDSFSALRTLNVGSDAYQIISLRRICEALSASLDRLPFSLRILLENVARREDGKNVRKADVEAIVRWNAQAKPEREIDFMPARVLLQDFTGVPAVVDLAAMRDAIARLGGKASAINPLIPCDLVIDHSVQVDAFGSADAFQKNVTLEFERNQERYAFLRWGQKAFRNFRVVPPGTGIVHQINLEYLAQVVFVDDGEGGTRYAYPDTLVGTDSHTTMINGLGVLGWGVGGIEAEAAMLGQASSMLIPEVVGFEMVGALPAGATATDLVLTATQMLRKAGVVGKFVEFFGPGLRSLSLADRATIANMAPEYGATMGFFPVDDETLSFLRFTGRGERAQLVEAYCKEQGLFYTGPEAGASIEFSSRLQLDLATVEPSLAGPKRPQDRVPLPKTPESFSKTLTELTGGDAAKAKKSVPVKADGASYDLGHGAVVIAAITSCTNTSNPAVLMAAGLLARKATERGLKAQPWVKTSLAPGSKVVTRYLRDAGLLTSLEAVGFNVVGYGCTTCIGNSGPLPEAVSQAVKDGELVVSAVLSGNRNFEGRVNPQVKANYLASPPLVVAYALAGTVEKDLTKEPIGTGKDGKPVMLSEIWPTQAEVNAAISAHLKPEQFTAEYSDVFRGDDIWRALPSPEGERFSWDGASTYVRHPPYFETMAREPGTLVQAAQIQGARVLCMLGDSVTTDHISPAGNIAKDSAAARYLVEHGVSAKDFNQYGARRGNDEVMVRGTFANIRLKNLLAPGTEGGVTAHLPDKTVMSIFDASAKYRAAGVPLIVLAGKEYGTGSSRDWAAKGPMLLGVRAVLAESFERIHRSNLVGMGILPLEYLAGQDRLLVGLTGFERYDVVGVETGLKPGGQLTLRATADDGAVREILVKVRIDTPLELEYYRHGGILQYVLRQLMA